MQKIVKSFSYDQQEILNDIIKLYCPEGLFDLDPCYSKGVFYKNGVVPEPKYKMDLLPQCDDVSLCDCRHTMFEGESLNSIVFDPPFLATKGKSLNDDEQNNVINKRFGVYPTDEELWNMYVDSVQEFYRILRHHGILVFKCQDRVSNSKQIIMHNKIINMCEDTGFVCEDLFVLLAKSRIVADWQAKNQKHARKYHSYFLVFKKK